MELTKRQQNIKALFENHSTYHYQWVNEFPLFPSVTSEELNEIKPLAKQISDRFHFAVLSALMARSKNYEKGGKGNENVYE